MCRAGTLKFHQITNPPGLRAHAPVCKNTSVESYVLQMSALARLSVTYTLSWLPAEITAACFFRGPTWWGQQPELGNRGTLHTHPHTDTHTLQHRPTPHPHTPHPPPPHTPAPHPPLPHTHTHTHPLSLSLSPSLSLSLSLPLAP